MSWRKYFKDYSTELGTKSPIGSTTPGASNTNSHSRYNTWLPEVYAGQPNRQERYYQYDMMDLDTEINSNDVFGTVEAVKTVSDLFMPVNGKVIDVNSSLEDNPEVVNDDPYGEGWIIKIEVSNLSDIDALMSSEEYKNLIGS